jgi:PAS domain S-box-containing protein
VDSISIQKFLLVHRFFGEQKNSKQTKVFLTSGDPKFSRRNVAHRLLNQFDSRSTTYNECRNVVAMSEGNPMQPLRALILEDSEIDASLLLRFLERNGYDVVHHRAWTSAALEQALLDPSWEVLLCDYSMPGFGAMTALDILKKKGIDLPFIVVSGAIGEEIAVNTMKYGAHDYVMKHNLARLAPAIERELRDAAVRRERKKAQEAVAYLAAIVESSEDAIIGTTLQGTILSWNAGAERIYGYSAEEVKGKSHSLLIPPHRSEETLTIYEKLKAGERIDHFETVRIRKDGLPLEVSLTISPIKNADGLTIGASTIAGDITERKRAEAERQRMIDELNEALSKVKLLSGLLPICSGCKRIRDDHGYWQQVERFIAAHSQAEFSHGICPDCMQSLYPEFGPR